MHLAMLVGNEAPPKRKNLTANLRCLAASNNCLFTGSASLWSGGLASEGQSSRVQDACFFDVIIALHLPAQYCARRISLLSQNTTHTIKYWVSSFRKALSVQSVLSHGFFVVDKTVLSKRVVCRKERPFMTFSVQASMTVQTLLPKYSRLPVRSLNVQQPFLSLKYNISDHQSQ